MKCPACGEAFKVKETRKRQQVVYRRLQCVGCGRRETSREALIAPPVVEPQRPAWTPKPRVHRKPQVSKPKAPPAPRKLKAMIAPVPELPRFGAHNPFNLAGSPAQSPSGCSNA